MAEQKFPAAGISEIVLDKILGNLQIKGWDHSDILIKTSAASDLPSEIQDGTLRIESKGNCLLRAPYDSIIRIESVQGNARIKLVDGTVHIDRIQGSLALRNVGSTQATVIQGDLLARQIVGDLHIDQVIGNAVVRDVEGECTIDQIHGNIELRDAEDDINVNASGNARIRLCMMIGSEYQIKAGGNIICKIPEDASLQAELNSGAKYITLRLPEEKQLIDSSSHTFTLGAGTASLMLVAGGKLTVATQEADWVEMDDIEAELDDAFAGISNEFSRQINAHIDAQLESQLEILDSQLDELAESLAAAGYSEAEAERTVQRAREESQQASMRAQEKMHRAQEKLDRKIVAAQRKVELKARAAERRQRSQSSGESWSYSGSAPTAAKPPKAPASDEERLMILRMLEQKKISLEEAEELLAAIEGS